MNDIIYLEPDAEITSVIDKIKKSQNDAVILVVPRGGTLVQSIINLKLLMRSAKEHSKTIALVSSDKIAQNLANQLKISIFSKVSDAEKAPIKPLEDETKMSPTESENPSGLQVNTYQRYSLSNLNAKAEEGKGEELEEVIPEEVDVENPKFAKRSIVGIEDSRTDEPEEIEEIRESQPTRGMDTIRVNDQSEKHKKIDVRTERRHIKTAGSRKTFFAILIAVFVVILAGLAFYYAPKADAVIVLKTRDINEKVDVAVNNETVAKAGEMIVAGQVLDVEKESTKNFNATGKKNVGETAKGTVTISNLYNYQNTVKLAKGTKISSDGKNFLLDTDVTIPVATAAAAIENNVPVLKIVPGTVNATVTAELPGDAYNLSPRKFTVAGYAESKISAESKTAFAGGTSKELKVVTEDDLKNAEVALKAEMLEIAKTELNDKAGQVNLKILESQITAEVITNEPSKKADDQADTFDLKLKVKYFVLAFAENDIKNSVTKGIEAKIGANEMIINPGESQISYKVKDGNIDDGTMNLEATFVGKVGNKLVASTIQKALKNKSKADAQNYLLSIDGVDSASIAIWPSFWQRTPMTLGRVKVKFDYKK